jgi:uncharacterized protein (TIGR02687 family)
MAKTTLRQIEERLRGMFTPGEQRKLVFWYDESASFENEVNQLDLPGVTVYRMEPRTQFATKWMLEIDHPDESFLIYAPFAKPPLEENHLADMLCYSQEYSTDKATMIAQDFDLDERTRLFVQEHINFFAAQDRTKRFYDLGTPAYTEETFALAMMAVLCKCPPKPEELVRHVLRGALDAGNESLQLFEKFGLATDFWLVCKRLFGYNPAGKNLKDLVTCLFATYAAHAMDIDAPDEWLDRSLPQEGEVLNFLDSMMNYLPDQPYFERFSATAAQELNVMQVLGQLQHTNPDLLLDCTVFAAAETQISSWIMNRLMEENTSATLKGYSIRQICEERSKTYFGAKDAQKELYCLLANACTVLEAVHFVPADGVDALAAQYSGSAWQVDTAYRKFYLSYGKVIRTQEIEKLQALVEKVYTSCFLDPLAVRWCQSLSHDLTTFQTERQTHFYSKNVSGTRERVVVFISDAMRYEVAQQLFETLAMDAKCTAKLTPAVSTVPSYTQLGMAALLPHVSLELQPDSTVTILGKKTVGTAARESILQAAEKNSSCIQFDQMQNMRRDELRSYFSGKTLVYVYHNQIDARGDEARTENEVFSACEEAVEELYKEIRRLTDNANIRHFIVTADHGFIYKRDKLSESEKIAGKSMENAFVNRRFVVSAAPLQDDGIGHMSMGAVLGNQDAKVVSYPVSSNVFKVAGGGANYVHGGSSPQEMLVPVLDIKMERGHQETKNAEIALVSILHKITNLITSMDFVQSEAVSDTVKPAKYRVFFISGDNEDLQRKHLCGRQPGAQRTKAHFPAAFYL